MCGNLLLNQDFGNTVIEIRKTTWPVGWWWGDPHWLVANPGKP